MREGKPVQFGENVLNLILIHEIIMSIQRFLRENGREVNFTADFIFTPLRTILDVKIKALPLHRLGKRPDRAIIAPSSYYS